MPLFEGTAVIHTAVIPTIVGTDDGSVNDGSAVYYTTLPSFTSFSMLP